MIKAIVVTAGAQLLTACSDKIDGQFLPDLWEDTQYDRPLSVQELTELGWSCVAWPKADEEKIDGQCGPMGAPEFTVYGIPRSASSVFLSRGYALYTNIQLNGSAGGFVADQLTRNYGSPEKLMRRDGSCDLVWRSASHAYKMYLGTGDPTKFVTLYAAPNALAFNKSESPNFFGTVRAQVFRLPCVKY